MMILRKLRALNRARQGFTLIEILIAIAITAIIGAAAASAALQITRINARSMNRQVAINQVQDAVHYFSRDCQQAQQMIPESNLGLPLPLDSSPPLSKAITFNLSGSPVNFLCIHWIDWTDNNKIKDVTYALASGVLTRNIIINNVTPGTTTTIATSITAALGVWHTDTKVLNFTLTATVGTAGTNTQAIETRTFQINPRPAQ